MTDRRFCEYRPCFLARASRQLPPVESRRRKHPRHLRPHDLPRGDLLRRQERLEGNPNRHPEGGPAHPVLWGAEGLGKDPGEDGCYR